MSLMHRLSLGTTVSFALAFIAVPAARVSAQQPAAAARPAIDTTPSPPANPADVASMDAILKSLYDVISGPAGQPRDWTRFRSLFVPGARLIPTAQRAGAPPTTRVMTPEDYATRSGSRLQAAGFFEHESARHADTFGSISQVFSTYESRHAANDPQPFARGINSIQLLNDGARWWIVSIYWQAERPDSPIPSQFLPKE